MPQFTFTNANDPLYVGGVPIIPVSSVSGNLNVTFDAAGNATVTGGQLQVGAGGFIQNLQTYTNFQVFRTVTNGVSTYRIVGTGNALGVPPTVTAIQITFTGQNPTSAQIAVGNPPVGPVPVLPILANNNAPVCFVAGTLIRTSRGEVAVEELRVGDLVETTSGKSRRVVWLGSNDIDIRLHHAPETVQPIRIAADAFGPGMPYRDLTVSPGHALCVRMLDEVLVPACVLVNDATITRLDVDHVSYWHVELDAHDILYSNGLPSESYIDVGNRTFFVDGDGKVDPQRTPALLADYCRPYVAEGALVTAMRDQLKLRAEKLGWRRDATPFADLHLEADGARIEPTIDGLTARFDLPAAAEDVWLVSAASVPAHVLDSHDTRRLGILLQGLCIEDEADTREVGLDHASLCAGFYPVEGLAGGVQRWTSGRARLPASLWQGAHGDLTIRIEMAAPPLPKWVAPAQSEATPLRDINHLSLVAA